MVLSKKYKCSGCKALDDNFDCLLGYPVTYLNVDGVKVSPKPKNCVKCYRPKSDADFKKATSLKNKRFKPFKKNYNSLSKDQYRILKDTILKYHVTFYTINKNGGLEITSYINSEKALCIGDNRRKLNIDDI